MRRRPLLCCNILEPREHVHRHRQILRLREIDEALGKIDIAFLQGALDLPFHKLRIAGGGLANLQVAERCRVVLAEEDRRCIPRMWPDIGKRRRTGRKACECWRPVEATASCQSFHPGFCRNASLNVVTLR